MGSSWNTGRDDDQQPGSESESEETSTSVTGDSIHGSNESDHESNPDCGEDEGKEEPAQTESHDSDAPTSEVSSDVDSDPNLKYEQIGSKEEPTQADSQDVPNEIHGRDENENEETIIIGIRAADVTLGLRRLPAGFYTAVQHSGHEWRTENKSVSAHDDNVEWREPIPLPSDLSATVCLVLYASFEFQPMLGNGEQLRKLTITVEQMLERSTKGVPFTFFPRDGDVVSPCSSILLVVGRPARGRNDSHLSRLADPCSSTTKSLGGLEEATNQGHGALSRYRKHEDERDLERSISYFEHALNVCSLDHPCRAAAQSNLAMVKLLHCQSVDVHPSFHLPLALYRDALAARPVGHLDRPSTLVHLAGVHYAQFQKRRDRFDAAQAETLLREALNLSSAESHEKRTAFFLLQLQAGWDADDFEESRPSFVGNPTSSLMGEDLWNTSVQLLERYERYSDLADLQQAITLLEEIVQSTSGWDLRHYVGLSHLGAALAHRFERLGRLEDLEQSIWSNREAVGFVPDGHFTKPHCLCHLGGTLALRFMRLGELRDLEEAILTLRRAVYLSPDGHLASLNHLGISLLSRFERLGNQNDLQEAILRLEHAVDLTRDRHPYRPAVLSNLANSLLVRFGCLGDPSDLRQAISKQMDAADLTPDGHIRKAGHLNNLGCLLYLRFEHFGDLGALEQAIFKFKETVDLTAHGHVHKPDRLNNLGMSYLSRFKHLGELIDLDQALLPLMGALHLISEDHPYYHRFLGNLGVTLKYRFERLKELSDIDRSISVLRKAVYLIPNDHPDKPDCLNNLGESLRIRFAHAGELSDVEEAISRHMDAIKLTSDGHSDKSARVNNLGNAFLVRFQRLGEPSDLDQTILNYMAAADIVPDGHPNKLGFLCNLGSAFLYRWERLGDLGDVEQAMLPYSRAACASIGPTAVRFEASEEWIKCARTLQHPSLLNAYSSAIGLLPQLAWIGYSLADRFCGLAKAGADVVMEAAAAALDAGQPETAVEWLEQGRSIVWGELFQLRSAYEELSSAYPDHARRLREVSTALEHVSAAHEKSLSSRWEHNEVLDHHSMMSVEKEAGTMHRTLAIARDSLLQEIRGLPGFERFLLQKDFTQLRASAHSGPVVILNAATTRCDALIVLAEVDHVIHVPLPDVTIEQAKGLQNMLKVLLGPTRVVSEDERVGKRVTRGCISWEFVLSILWTGVVKPILDAIGFSSPGDLLRIFWCPTGPFAFLPIHAAGLYGTQSLEPGQKLSDFVVSSYIPTLSVLAPSLKPDPTPRKDLRLLIVSQPSSDGQSRLPGVDTELRWIKGVVQNAPSTRTTLMESSAGTVEEVLELMQRADWVHFACHGIQDAEYPSDSGLCLADKRRLKLSDVISVSRPRGGLAFLSACQTATGHKRLSDEAVHIAAGMLFAGYGGVIGTMWSISDRLAPRVARDVYAQLFRKGMRPDYRDAARALHDAVGRLRDGNASFVEWLPFIHVGL